jgi:branched-chain amino acid transport system substrate-binding protein
MMSRKFAAAAAAALLAVVAAASAAAQDVALGLLAQASGPYVALAGLNEIAARMAVDEVNAAGGVGGRKLKLVVVNTNGTIEQAAAGLRRLADEEKVVAVVGPFSSTEAKEAFKVGERLGVPTMSMASSAPGLAAPYTFAFRNVASQETLLVKTMESVRTAKYPRASAAVAYVSDDVVSKSLGEAVIPGVFKKAGADIRAVAEFKTTTDELAPYVAQLVAAPTDLIGLGTPPGPGSRMIKALRAAGHKGRFLAGSTMGDPGLARQLGADGEGFMTGTTWHEELDGRTRAFAAEFKRRAGAANASRTQANQFDASTFDIVLIYAQALKDAKVAGDPARLQVERGAVRDAVRKMRDFPALEGKVSFGDDGDARPTVYVLEAASGAWKLLGTYRAD